MSIELLTLSGSPFGWKAQLALGHLGIDHVTTFLSVDRGDLRTPAFLAMNPHGKLPVLIDGAATLYESDVIVEYLEDAYAGRDDRLWPRTPLTRAHARRIAAECTAYLYPPVRSLVMRGTPRTDRDHAPAAIDAAKRAIGERLNAFAKAARADFLADDRPGAADYALYPLVALLRRIAARRPDEALAALVPDSLLAWARRIEALDFYPRTYPPHWNE